MDTIVHPYLTFIFIIIVYISCIVFSEIADVGSKESVFALNMDPGLKFYQFDKIWFLDLSKADCRLFFVIYYRTR